MTGTLGRQLRPAIGGQAGVGIPPLPRLTVPLAAAEPRGPGRPVLYGCFSCHWCYLASQHSDQFTDLTDGPQWRMVVPDPHLPVSGLKLDAAARSRLETELAAVRTVLLPGEQLPAQVPGFVPHTGPAVAGYAEAYGAGVADQVRRVLFDAYWQHGGDIGSPEVLRRLLVHPILAGHSTSWPLRESGYAVTLAGGPITTEAYCYIRDWRSDWEQAVGNAHLAMVDGEAPSPAKTSCTRYAGPATTGRARCPFSLEPAGRRRHGSPPARLRQASCPPKARYPRQPEALPTAPSAPPSPRRANPTERWRHDHCERSLRLGVRPTPTARAVQSRYETVPADVP